MEHLRALLERYIDTSNLTNHEVLRIIEAESLKRDSFIKLDDLIKKD